MSAKKEIKVVCSYLDGRTREELIKEAFLNYIRKEILRREQLQLPSAGGKS